jgi:hypothetical protein
MRPLFLHLDGALAGQRTLLADGAARGGIELDGRILGPALRLWARNADLLRLRGFLNAALPAGEDDPIVTFYGSGDFHHVAALLIDRAVTRLGEPVTVVHVDNHPDWVRFRHGLHCGSWVGSVARLPQVVRVLTVGPCSSDIVQSWRKGADLSLVRSGAVELYPYGTAEAVRHRVCGVSRPTIAGLGEPAFLDMLCARIQTEAVYVTIDKDALRPEDAVSNWDQGRLSFQALSRLIARLGATRRIVGADICGDWSPAVYGGPLLSRARKQIEAWLDQPRTPPAPAALGINETVNRALLGCFGEAA